MRGASLARHTGLLLFLLSCAGNASAQADRRESAEKPNLGTTQILYTGKMLGYFRIPEWQSGSSIPPGGCPEFKPRTNIKEEDKTPSELFFEQKLRAMRGAVLVGTGDNFAPQIESRTFWPLPMDQKYLPRPNLRAGKELFSWYADQNRWVTNEEASNIASLQRLLGEGKGTIPTDNVGCFLIRAGYAAVVPGKHDFYFGTERLRQLARFLATTPIPDEEKGVPRRHVQMLGANIVMKTSWKSSTSRPTDGDKPPKFIPGFPTMNELLPGNPLKLEFSGLRDGGTVYPWFQGALLNIDGLGMSKGVIKELQSSGSHDSLDNLLHFLETMVEKHGSGLDEVPLRNLAKVVATLNSSPFFLCPAKGGDPNNISVPLSATECQKVLTTTRVEGATLRLKLVFQPIASRKAGEHFSTVKPGENYGLCMTHTVDKPDGKRAEETFCARFSVHVPFFYHPSVAPSAERSNPMERNSYKDPEPYVLLKSDKAAGRPLEIVIFGVVDPDIRGSIGVLNSVWTNNDERFKTEMAIEDPAVALQQLLAYFENKYEMDNPNGRFTGLKVLLAQMTPQRAQALMARLKGFNIVVTAADEELATGAETAVISWTDPSSRESASPLPSLTYMAVPSSYYATLPNPHTQVKIGSLEIAHLAPQSPWSLTTGRFQSSPREPSIGQAPQFWKLVAEELNRECLPQESAPICPAETTSARLEQIQLITLCAMRKALGADVAMLQKRDFFSELPADVIDINHRRDNLQQILDRIIWKGDFLTLLYLPGSALASIMRQSKRYDDEDASKLSIANERSRALVTLGLKADPKSNGYLLNEVPVDPNRLYAVATTDFVRAGDTDYPELAAASIGSAAIPSDFDEQLETISSAVCRRLAGDRATTACIGAISRDKYFDKLSLAPSDQRPGNTHLNQIWSWSLFHRPDSTPRSSQKKTITTAGEKVQLKVEQRPIWELSVQKFSLGTSGISNNLSDEEIDEKFAGITTPSVTAHRKINWASDLQMRLSRSSHSHELFVSPGVRYNVEYVGISNAPTEVTQLANVSSVDAGVNLRFPNRSLPHLNTALSLHFETQTTRPFATFVLGTQTIVDPVNNVRVDDKLRFRQDRSWTVLPRLGLRWQDRVSFIEAGVQAGKEFNAVDGYRFTRHGLPPDVCLPNSSETIADCVKRKSQLSETAVAKDSTIEVLRSDRYRAGIYWKVSVTVPLLPRVSYVLDDEGEFFATNFRTDNATDTRFRDYSKHQLKFSVWPSLSIGPAFNVLLYENKINRDFLHQRQFMFQIDMSFGLFNKRDLGSQFKYKQPTKSQ
jgi:hypothetical protein